MTPKEKAKEIYDNMKGFRVTNAHRKKCALSAIDLLISGLPKLLPYGLQYINNVSYWEEVKEEIEKL